MCGIVGLAYHERSVSAEDNLRIKSILNKLTYRGPDGTGVWMDEKIILGHRRLSIIDLSDDGSQPFVDPSRGLYITFNGEIYNYQEIRKDLIAHGYQFKSKSDTEVILYAYDYFGLECLRHFQGMFAFCLYDQRRHKIILSRDPIGEKPLFYFMDQNSIAFSSEIKAFHGLADIPLEIDPQSVESYFTLQYIPGVHTIYKSIREVRPGTCLEIDLKDWKSNEKVYWSLIDQFETSDDFDSGKIDRCISNSVRLRLVGDVKMGILLSGGIDSSLLAWHIKNQGGDLMAFTARFKQGDLDESPYAEQVAKALGMELMIINGGSLTAPIYDDVVFHADEPIGDAACIPTYLLAKELSQYVKVVLSGEGADELFLGYDFYRHELLCRRNERLINTIQRLLNNPKFFRDQGASLNVNAAISRISKIFFSPYDTGVSRWTTVFGDLSLERLLVEKTSRSSNLHSYLFEMQEVMVNLRRRIDPGLSSLSLDLHFWLPDDLFVKVDRMSMAHSVEARAPFLDTDLIKAALNLPLQEKIKGSAGKMILRKLINGKFPAQLGATIAWRKKHGFETPITNWMKSSLRELVEDRLSAKKLSSSGLFNIDFATNLKNAFMQADNPRSIRRHLWLLLCFQSWFEWHQKKFEFGQKF